MKTHIIPNEANFELELEVEEVSRSPKSLSVARGLQQDFLNIDQPNVLIVEDDPEIVNTFSVMNEKREGKWIVTSNSGQALRYMVNNPIESLILDWNLPDFKGDSLVRMADELVNYQGLKLKNKIPLITHSCEKKVNIDLSWSKNFIHIDHWQKPFNFHKLQQRCHQFISVFLKS